MVVVVAVAWLSWGYRRIWQIKATSDLNHVSEMAPHQSLRTFPISLTWNMSVLKLCSFPKSNESDGFF